MDVPEATLWAEQEFGRARIGDRRRTRRLVEVAAAAAKHPAGRITEVLSVGAEREGAFRLIENEHAGVKAIARAAHEACAARSAEHRFVFVPVDASSLNLADWERTKGLGVVGARFVGARGLIVVTAIALAPDGTPLGLCGQKWWARRGRSRGRRKHDKRLVESKETQHWLDVMRQARDVFAKNAPSTRPWFQLDRGGDAWPVLLQGLEPGQLFTVRAAYDRRLWGKDDEPRRYLWEQVEKETLLGSYELAVPSRAGRKARTARIGVRSREVTLSLLDERTDRRSPATLTAVLACEQRTTPRGEEPIEWLLLTTHPVRTMRDAELVLQGYAQRWRVEEFHKVWKSGACRVEETQLRDRDRIIRWATILASVAMRIMRLTYLARTRPDLPATVELAPAEVAAVVALKARGERPGAVPCISQVVLWLAEIGGYTGKSSGGPPGAIVIRRGLERIQSLAAYLASEARSD